MPSKSRSTFGCDGVPFGEGTNELVICGKVKEVISEAEGKPSLNRAT